MLAKLCLLNCSLHLWRRDVLVHSWNPLGFLHVGQAAASRSSYSNQLGQPQTPDRGVVWRTSFTPMQGARSQMKQWRGWGKPEEQPLIWWNFALSTATKITVGLLFPEEIFWKVIFWSVMSPCAGPGVWQSAPEHVWHGAGNLINTHKKATEPWYLHLHQLWALTCTAEFTL